MAMGSSLGAEVTGRNGGRTRGALDDHPLSGDATAEALDQQLERLDLVVAAGEGRRL
jgi:hypothetical protein